MIESSQIRTVIFDLDGTLYNNKRLPLRLVLADIPNMFVLGAERLARKSLQGTDLQDAAGVYDALFTKMAELKRSLTFEKAKNWYQQRYMPLQVALLAMYYGPNLLVPETLEALRQKGIKMVVYSDYGHEYEKLQAIGLDPALFDGIVSAAKMGGLKPCKASMERLVKQFDIDPASTLYVGDRDDTDKASADAIGISYINVKKDKNAWDKLAEWAINGKTLSF